MILPKTRAESRDLYRDMLFRASLEGEGQERAVMAYLGKNDLYYLLTRVLKREDIRNDWMFERCREVQANPNGHLDLWAREHRKSTIITFGLTIQDILHDPEICIGIFSITRPLAKDFLEQIRSEFELNQDLKDLYPDVLWQDPQNQAPTWSLDDGIVVKRSSNPRENTLEAYGLIEGLPTGKHFQIRVYDDTIDQTHVTQPEIMKKAAERWELSLNLGSDRKVKRYDECDIARYIGTRYHYNDIYATILKRHAAIPRIHPATDNGKMDGRPVYFSEELFSKKRREMGPYTAACQLLLDPKADEVQGFDESWFEYWHPKEEFWEKMNVYIIVDPASEKKKTSDYTVMWVIGLHGDKNYYLIDGVRDRLNLVERCAELFRLHKKYSPNDVGYEKYGMQADIEHFQYMMGEENYRFGITPLGGQMPKNDRIRRLIPPFADHRVFIPHKLGYKTREGNTINLTKYLIDEELLAFPVSSFDDAMDCFARIMDPEMGASFPKPVPRRIPGQTTIHELSDIGGVKRGRRERFVHRG